MSLGMPTSQGTEEEEDLSALDTLEFVGIVESGDFEIAIAPRASSQVGSVASKRVAPSQATAPTMDTGVALLADGDLECGSAAGLGLLSGVDPMLLYEKLRLLCSQQHLAVATQMMTRSGRVVASSITAADRRERLAEFVVSSMAELQHLELQNQQVLVPAGELQLWAMGVDEVRVFSALFAVQPSAAELKVACARALADGRQNG